MFLSSSLSSFNLDLFLLLKLMLELAQILFLKFCSSRRGLSVSHIRVCLFVKIFKDAFSCSDKVAAVVEL